MSVKNKPDYKIFADGAKPGEVVEFPDILRGWGVTLDTTGGIPPMDFFNATGKRTDEWLLYLTQRGIPEWDSAVDYPKSSLTQRNGEIYIAKSENKGSKPESSQQIWDPLYKFLGVDLKLDKSSVIGTVGQSETSVMSQKAATNAFQPRGNYQTAGNYADKSATVKQRFSDAIQCKYGIEIADNEDGIAAGLYSTNGKTTLTSGGAVIEVRNKSGIMALTNEIITSLRLSTPRVVDSRIDEWMNFSTSEIVVGMLMKETPGGGPWVVNQLRVARLQAFINGAWVNVTQ